MYRTIFLLFSALAVARASGAEDFLVEALRANPEISAAYQSYLAASTKGTQVKALEEPVLSYSEFLTSVQTRTGPQERSYAISQSFPWPGVLKLRERVADAKAREAYYRYETMRRQVLERVGLARIEYAYLKEATDRAAENLGLLKQIKPVVEEKVRAGGSLATSLRLDVELAVADQEVVTLRDQRPGLDAQLKTLLGRDPEGDPLPWPDLPSQPPALMPLGSIKSEVKTHHPKLRLAEAGIRTAEEGEVLAGKNGLPAFTVGANAIDIGNGGDTASSVMLGVKLPLRREKYRAEKEEAAAMTFVAGATFKATEQALLAEAVRFYASQQEAISRWQNYSSKLIPAATQAADLTREDFRNDKANLTDLIEAERILLDLRLMQTRALADAHKAAWQIRALTEHLSESTK